ncbi:MAG: ABC transporter permease [Candidatus Bathyarchaeota archaeon]|nr:ABC transporter permease [Candidatus Bathyarchaeota archaeon]MDH5787730.1 ABC transporter permease [Candidatus Bathyarchaeota archaeon]
MGLREYVAKRAVYSIALVLIVITINFAIFMVRSPVEMFASERRLRPEQIEELEIRFGLLEPLHIRYLKYLQNLLTFQFGYSYRTGESISEEVSSRLSNTLALCVTAEIVAVALGLLLGVVAAYERGKIADTFFSVFSVVTQGLPVFWIGMLLLFIFSYSLGWFPLGHSEPPEWAIHGRPDSYLVELAVRFWYLLLPALTLVIITVGGYVLLTRASMLEVLSEDYLVTLKAKGLSNVKILFKHALKNASLPLITQVAIAFAFTLSGALVTETIFSYPGLGMWIWTSIEEWDYPALQAIFYIVSICVIAGNFLVDMIYGAIDPRIRYG